MLTLFELNQYLLDNNIEFEIIAHSKPIISKMDAADIFDIDKAAPAFVLKSENHIFTLITSSKIKHIDFKLLKSILGCSNLCFADKKEVFDSTGYEIGSIPLIGHGLPCILDAQLFDFVFIYGGSGDSFHTLKISPNDVLKLNNAKTISFCL